MLENEFDLIVAGAGPAGLCAATQAGRSGLKTLLLEKSGMSGGTTTLNGVNFPGLFHAWGRQVIAGYGWDLVRGAVEESGKTLPDFSEWHRPHWELQIPVDVAVFTALADRMVVESGSQFLFHAMPVAADWRVGGWIVQTALKEGLREFRAKFLIDATGDGNLAALSGFGLRRNAHMQPATLIFRLGGYDPEALDFNAIEEAFAKEVAGGRLQASDVGSHSSGARSFLLNFGNNKMHIPGVDASTSAGKTEAELRGRAALLRLLRFFRKQRGLEHLRVEYLAPECGIRETATLEARTIITEDDYISGRTWPDSLCHAFYPIDIHRPDGDGIDIRQLREGVVPTVPLTAMSPASEKPGAGFFLCAGRTIGSDQAAHSGLRVQAACMAMGQSAAAAAVVALCEGTAALDADPKAIRSLLRDHGAITPGE